MAWNELEITTETMAVIMILGETMIAETKTLEAAIKGHRIWMKYSIN